MGLSIGGVTLCLLMSSCACVSWFCWSWRLSFSFSFTFSQSALSWLMDSCKMLGWKWHPERYNSKLKCFLMRHCLGYPEVKHIWSLAQKAKEQCGMNGWEYCVEQKRMWHKWVGTLCGGSGKGVAWMGGNIVSMNREGCGMNGWEHCVKEQGRMWHEWLGILCQGTGKDVAWMAGNIMSRNR